MVRGKLLAEGNLGGQTVISSGLQNRSNLTKRCISLMFRSGRQSSGLVGEDLGGKATRWEKPPVRETHSYGGGGGNLGGETIGGKCIWQTDLAICPLQSHSFQSRSRIHPASPAEECARRVLFQTQESGETGEVTSCPNQSSGCYGEHEED